MTSLAVVLVAVLATGAWAAYRLYEQAQSAGAHLSAAIPYAEEVQTALLASDPAAAEAAARAFSEEAAKAEAATEGRLWGFVSGIPLPITENLKAVRLVTEIAGAIGTGILQPASALDVAAIKPVEGRIDLSALQLLSDGVTAIDEAADSSLASLRTLDRGALIEQVDGGVSQVESALERLHEVLSPAKTVLSVLPEALGASGPRSYLVMFQGNAEARASGGGPGSFILIRAEDGSLSIANEAAATDFDIALPEPVLPLDAETESVYSDIIGRWIANLTATPDFPTSAALAKAWWSERFDDQIDGVVSIDPVALGYLLAATGPLQLPTGETLTTENAASLLLNEAYFVYPTGVESNLFFAGATASVFAALTQGGADPAGLLAAVGRAADESRIKVWSADADEQALLGTSPAAGVLPLNNEDETTIGVFFNDTTGSKMDYYVDAAVDVSTDLCTASAEPRWTTSVVFKNSISRAAAADLPLYITGPYYTPGDIATDFVVYAPVGAQIESWTLDGETHPAISHTAHLGRDVIRVGAMTSPESTSTLVVTMVGEKGSRASDYGPLAVRSTPLVRDTPVAMSGADCG